MCTPRSHLRGRLREEGGSGKRRKPPGHWRCSQAPPVACWCPVSFQKQWVLPAAVMGSVMPGIALLGAAGRALPCLLKFLLRLLAHLRTHAVNTCCVGSSRQLSYRSEELRDFPRVSQPGRRACGGVAGIRPAGLFWDHILTFLQFWGHTWQCLGSSLVVLGDHVHTRRPVLCFASVTLGSSHSDMLACSPTDTTDTLQTRSRAPDDRLKLPPARPARLRGQCGVLGTLKGSNCAQEPPLWGWR